MISVSVETLAGGIGDYFRSPPKACEEEELRRVIVTCQAAKAPETSLYSFFITRVMRYLQENYQDEELDLTRVAEEFELSPNYFSRIFKRMAGVTPKVFQLDAE